MPIVYLPEIVFQPHRNHHRFRDLTGAKFGRLTVIGYAGVEKNVSYWYCQCGCGHFVRSAGSSLGKGAKSCGCYNLDVARQRNTTHGMTYSSEYRIWSLMLDRCKNPKNSRFHRYGGRGIAVCERWLKFENFYADLGARPSLNHSIDRIDSNGNYEPGNVQWATPKEQQRNRCNNRMVNHNGALMSFAEACEIAGVSHKIARLRVYRGASPEDTIRELINAKNNQQSNHKSHT